MHASPGQARAYFFLIRMCERHNRRNIGDRILALNPADLLELCAAYKLEVPEGMPSDDLKEKLITRLIEGEHSYDLEALDAHRAKVTAPKE